MHPGVYEVYSHCLPAVEKAAERGWSDDEQERHIDAVERWNAAMGDPVAEGDMASTHPFNYLTEQEVESLG